jgi:hypothetical protein
MHVVFIFYTTPFFSLVLVLTNKQTNKQYFTFHFTCNSGLSLIIIAHRLIHRIVKVPCDRTYARLMKSAVREQPIHCEILVPKPSLIGAKKAPGRSKT